MNLIVLFLFCIIFLDFFHFPDSTFKRFRNYTKPLCLERAKGIFVSPNEKELYESLSFYLSINFDKEDKMVVGGYYPQFSFLTKQKNIFEFEEYIFENLRTLLKIAAKREEIGPILASFEDKIISKMEQKRPEIFLTVTGNSLRDYRFISSRIESYIEKNYYLDKIFGPADVWGMGGPVGWVNLYRLKENRS